MNNPDDETGGTKHDWKNPMRFALRGSIDMADFDVDVTEIEIKSSEGNVYAHWARETERVIEFGGRLAGAVATMSSEADELAARRPHPDAHLYHVESGLRLRADGLRRFLQREYYR